MYVATLDAPLSQTEAAAAARRFASGTLTLAGDRAPLLPAALKVLDDGRTAEVALAEGRYHQARRSCVWGNDPAAVSCRPLASHVGAR